MPFLVAAVEDYFKSTFVALLRYAPKKASFLKGVRSQGDQLLAIADGKHTVEEQVVETLPFHRPAMRPEGLLTHTPYMVYVLGNDTNEYLSEQLAA